MRKCPGKSGLRGRQRRGESGSFGGGNTRMGAFGNGQSPNGTAVRDILWSCERNCVAPLSTARAKKFYNCWLSDKVPAHESHPFVFRAGSSRRSAGFPGRGGTPQG